MRITVRFYDGREPRKLEAITAPEVLRQVKDNKAFITIPFDGGVEVMRYLPETDRFVFSSAPRLTQAVEDLFTGGHA